MLKPLPTTYLSRLSKTEFSPQKCASPTIERNRCPSRLTGSPGLYVPGRLTVALHPTRIDPRLPRWGSFPSTDVHRLSTQAIRRRRSDVARL